MNGLAAVFVGVRKPFDLREFPLGDPGSGELIVEMIRTNVCGSDLHIWRGDTDLAKLGVAYPIILGHEMVGRVLRAGRGADADALGRSLKEGDRVVWCYYAPCGKCRACLRGQNHACMMSLASLVRPCEMPPHFVGGFATHYVVRRGQKVFKVPDEAQDAEVAGANCALSQVVFGLGKVGLTFGETVVVQGAGGLGLYACAIAKEMGASRVIAIDGVPARLELARRLGADEIIDIGQLEGRARIERVKTLTDGWGADVVVEVVGSPAVIPEGIKMLGRGGRYLELGSINPKQTYVADPSILVGNNISIHGVSLYEPHTLERSLDFIARARKRLPFDAIASHTFPLARIDEAFQQADVFAGTKGAVTRVAIREN